jgi:dihydrofolate reductase
MLTSLLSLIVAAAEDGAIGRDNRMLWHLPADFRWFKEKTMGHPVIMGRKTMESLGKALPGRRNLVITRGNSALSEGFEAYSSLEAAIASARETDAEEIFIIGGGEVYRQAIPLADRIYYTRVHVRFPDASAHFYLPGEPWELVWSMQHPRDEKHALDFSFEIWEPKANH